MAEESAFIHTSDAAKNFRKLLLKTIYKNVIVMRYKYSIELLACKSYGLSVERGNFLGTSPFTSLLVQQKKFSVSHYVVIIAPGKYYLYMANGQWKISC